MNMNMMKIAQAAAVECERQHVGLDRLVTLLDAYVQATGDGQNALTRENLAEQGVSLVSRIAGIVEPSNGGQLRTTPVTFKNGGSAASADSVGRSLVRLCEMGGDLTADEWVQHFLWIHPFSDGNGRVGWLLYNAFKGSFDEPLPLPAFSF